MPNDVESTMDNSPLYEAEQAMGPFAYALFLETKLREARDLIQWFALKWHENNPLFPEFDEMTQTPLPANARLSATWYEVVRGGVKCPECEGRRYRTAPTENDRVVTVITCEVCGGTGFTKSEG